MFGKILRERHQLIHVEVARYNKTITRSQSKKNLKSVLSYRHGLRKLENDLQMFDRDWYSKRH